MFGKPSVFKEYKGLIVSLQTGERTPPQHRRPGAVTDSGFESFATEDAQAIFEGFDYFGALLNRHVEDPWMIEEQPETLLKTRQIEGPSLGRTYKVSYNGVPMGSLQVTAGFHLPSSLHNDVEWHRKNRAAIVAVELDNLRFIPYTHAVGFVAAIELFVGPWQDGVTSRSRARLEASARLTGYLWEVMRQEEAIPQFRHRIEGPYDLLKTTTDHWKAEGVDPFARWGGDR